MRQSLSMVSTGTSPPGLLAKIIFSSEGTSARVQRRAKQLRARIMATLPSWPVWLLVAPARFYDFNQQPWIAVPFDGDIPVV